MNQRMAWVRSHKKPKRPTQTSAPAPSEALSGPGRTRVRAKSLTNIVHAVAGQARTAAVRAKAAHNSAVEYARDWYQERALAHQQEQQRLAIIDQVHGKHTHEQFERSEQMAQEEAEEGLEPDVVGTAEALRQNKLSRAQQAAARSQQTARPPKKQKKALVWRNSYDREADASTHGTPSRLDKTFLEDVRVIPSRHDQAY